MYKRILVPIDGSDASLLGLREAIRIAGNQRARLRLVHVVNDFVVAQYPNGYPDVTSVLDTLREGGKKIMDKGLALARKHSVSAQGVLHETMGKRVSEYIIREAKKWPADLIVMGTHGRRGFNRMMLGSDAEAVLRTAPVPVLTVRASPSTKRAKNRTR